MNVGVEELERIIRRYVSTGAAIVIVLLGPGQGDAPADARATTVTVEPGSGAAATGPPSSRRTRAPSGAPRTTAPPPGSDVQPPADDTPTTGVRTPAPRSTPPVPTPPVTTPAPGTTSRGEPRTTAADGTTAAATHGWGTPTRTDDFDAGLGQWSLYDGVGHDGKGRRSPGAASVQDGVLTITGDPSGTTAGMSWGQGRRYGRWEVRVRAPASDPSYNAVLLLWPDADDRPGGGEIDFMEMSDPARRTTDAFVHYGDDDRQVHGRVETDATQWHNWAVEWTPSSIAMFLDGREWYRTTQAEVQPPGPMHLCVQLDWFPEGGVVRESTMQVDRVREYALDGRPPTGAGRGADGG